MKPLLSIIIVFFVVVLRAHDELEPGVKQLQKGNLAVSSSQQLSALFSFGQNIIPANVSRAEAYTDYIYGPKKNLLQTIPSLLFGVRDNLSIFLGLPVACSYTEGSHYSEGVQDFFAQVEYAWYVNSNTKGTTQATVVGTLFMPTGSARHNPALTFGAPAAFFGVTLNRLETEWYIFLSQGFLCTASNNNHKVGNQILTHFGIGRNIRGTKEYVISWLVELLTTVLYHDIKDGRIDKNSGGTTFYCAPSLFFSTPHYVIQCGIAFPLSQALSGAQIKTKYIPSINISVTF